MKKDRWDCIAAIMALSACFLIALARPVYMSAAGIAFALIAVGIGAFCVAVAIFAVEYKLKR